MVFVENISSEVPITKGLEECKLVKFDRFKYIGESAEPVQVKKKYQIHSP